MKRPPIRPPAGPATQGEKLLVDREDTLLAFVIASLPKRSRNDIKAALRGQGITVAGRVVTRFDHPLSPGQVVEVCWHGPALAAAAPGLTIVHEDDDLIVIDKPGGLLTVATDREKRRTAYAMLSDYLKSANPEAKIFIVHRLDRETSGLLLFAKSEEIKRRIQETWESTVAERSYVAVVQGEVLAEKGTVTSYLTESSALVVYSSPNPKHGRKSVTHYRRLRGNGIYSLLELNLDSGRKHQIRVHMQDLGHPVVGDSKYGATANPLRRLCLHARVLAFHHPRSGQLCRFETPIPAAFLRLFRPPKGV